MKYLVFCPCGHGLDRHARKGAVTAADAAIARCACSQDLALDAVIEHARPPRARAQISPSSTPKRSSIRRASAGVSDRSRTAVRCSMRCPGRRSPPCAHAPAARLRSPGSTRRPLCARRRGHGALRAGGRPADARPAVRARRRQQRRAAGRAAGLRAVHRRRRARHAGAGAAGPHSRPSRTAGVSRDGRTITYHLRANVKWQDGVPVTARDVVWTLAAILDDRNPVRSRAGYDRVARADVVDLADRARHAQGALGAGGRDAVQLRHRAAVRAARRTC